MASEFGKTAQFTASFQGMMRLPIARQLGLLLGLAASVVLGMFVVVWSGSPDYSVLYDQSPVGDSNKILNVLQQRNIAFKLDTSNGKIMVDSSKLDEARMALAVQHLPQFVGDEYELPGKVQGFAASSFIRNVRYQRALENRLARNVENILSLIVGPNNVRALVVASMDFTQGDIPAPGRHAHTSAAAKQKVRKPGSGVNDRGNEEPRIRFTNEQQDRVTASQWHNPGEIKRLSVAVVVDHKNLRNSNDGRDSTDYTDDELQRFTVLAKEAVGFDTKRGDTIDVINAEILTIPALTTVSGSSFVDKSWFRDAGRQVPAMLLAVLMVFGVLRPVMRKLATSPHTKASVSSSTPEIDQVTEPGEQARNSTTSDKYESDLAIAKSLVLREPKRVAKVVKLWVNEG
jgi:flagellar biosynthesis/type III secretory pathway M-ring protein FliF/YscJ